MDPSTSIYKHEREQLWQVVTDVAGVSIVSGLAAVFLYSNSDTLWRLAVSIWAL
jgi:hypothetical protein